MNEKDEKRLCAALRRGETKALEAVASAYSGYVCSVARNFSRGALSEEDIDEISVDVFYKLWKYRESVNAGYGLRAYLSAITRNAVKDRFRAMPQNVAELDESIMPSGFSVEETAELREVIESLYAEMEKLPADEREIFFRAYFYGEKCADIARKRGIAENTVYTKLRRTRLKLKKIMTEKGF